MLYVAIPPQWLRDASTNARVVQFDGEMEEALRYNIQGYGIYYYPNYPSEHSRSQMKSRFVQACHIDCFEWVFADLDLKDYRSTNPDRTHSYASKEEFIAELIAEPNLLPTRIVDSGRGVHAYWRVNDLSGMAFLRLSRRLCRKFHTDPAVTSIKQLMRVPGTVNTKDVGNPVMCEDLLFEPSRIYTAEELDRWLPPITLADDEFCTRHYTGTVNGAQATPAVNDSIPLKFRRFLSENAEAKSLFAGSSSDRSRADYRLAHLMLANDFTREEAISVLMNCSKALSRTPQHRLGYAQSIAEKVWGQEPTLECSIQELLAKPVTEIDGVRIRCHPAIDNTVAGFRLGQVLGLVAGSGVGKTAFSLNMFRWFLRANPDFHHFFIALEEEQVDIARRWRDMCAGDSGTFDHVHVISNLSGGVNSRHLSLHDIEDYLVKWQRKNNKKIGTVVIDHIGALRKNTRNGESEGLIDICQQMKSFAVRTQTFLIMMSQAPREKAGDGDLEMFKSCAYGTVFFESFCDWLVGIWQPVKRCHSNEGCPKVTAYKFCKIRHKNAKRDVIQEDVPYYLAFDPDRQRLREMTQLEEDAFQFWDERARQLRTADKKSNVVRYTKVAWNSSEDGGD